MRKLFAALALTLALVVPGMAGHDETPVKMPHHIAQWGLDNDLRFIVSKVRTFFAPGCDTMIVLPLVSPSGQYFGVALHAENPTTLEQRLIFIQMYDRNLKGRTVLSWKDMKDYLKIKACHEGGKEI